MLRSIPRVVVQLEWYSRTYTLTATSLVPLYNGHFFSSRRTKNSYIDSCLKPLNNDHLFTMATFFCPQGGRSQRGSTVASIPLMAYAAILKTKPVIS